MDTLNAACGRGQANIPKAVAGTIFAAAVLFVSGLSFACEDGAQGLDTRPDLMVSLSSTKIAWPRHDITITVTVKNVGGGPAPRSGCQVLIKNAHAPRQTVRTIKKTVRAMDVGDQYAFSFSLKLGVGLYEIVAETDRKRKIPESDETNNQVRLTVAGR